ncbi:MAG: hypothetical protein AAFQ71_08765 [Planctomycetota bacterium]
MKRIDPSDEEPKPGDPTSFWLTHAAFASPEWWQENEPQFIRTLFRAQPVYHTAFTDRKALLIGIHRIETDATATGSQSNLTVPVTMVDGSAERTPHVELDGPLRFRATYGSVTWRGVMTLDGLRGIDY